MQRSAGRESCSGVDDNELMEVFPSGTILPHSVERFCGVDASGTLGSISCLGHFAWACSATRFQPPAGSRWCAAHAVFLMTTEIVCNMSNNFKKKIFRRRPGTWDKTLHLWFLLQISSLPPQTDQPLYVKLLLFVDKDQIFAVPQILR